MTMDKERLSEAVKGQPGPAQPAGICMARNSDEITAVYARHTARSPTWRTPGHSSEIS
jgi:hypothetical protein